MKKAKQKTLSPLGLITVFLALVMVLWAALPGLALTIYDESINGDLSNLDMPIQFTLRTAATKSLAQSATPLILLTPLVLLSHRGSNSIRLFFWNWDGRSPSRYLRAQPLSFQMTLEVQLSSRATSADLFTSYGAVTLIVGNVQRAHICGRRAGTSVSP